MQILFLSSEKRKPDKPMELNKKSYTMTIINFAFADCQ